MSQSTNALAIILNQYVRSEMLNKVAILLTFLATKNIGVFHTIIINYRFYEITPCTANIGTQINLMTFVMQ